MAVYTSYFGVYSKVRAALPLAAFIAISRSTPTFVRHLGLPTEKLLIPSADLLTRYRQGVMTPEEYKRVYLQQLNKVMALNLVRRWMKEPYDVVLFCYEASTDFCHRHVLSEFLRQNGCNVEEYLV
jgi:hypothetical protein